MSKNVSIQNKNAKQTSLSRIAIVAATAAMMILPAGCQTVNGVWSKNALSEALVVSYRDMVWAKRAFNLRYGNCQRPYAQHFENGFCAGYSNVCAGGDGYVPALPPESYRGYEYQTADGAKCINSWFEGYPAGVAAAKKDNAGTYHDVLISRMIDTAIKQEAAAKQKPAASVPVVQPNDKSIQAQPISAPITTPITTNPSFDYTTPPPATVPPIVPSTSSSSNTIMPPIVQADYQPMSGTNAPLPMGASRILDTDGPTN